MASTSEQLFRREPAKASPLALARWLAAYPIAAASLCFALGALAKTAGQVATPVFTILVAGVVGWEAARDDCSERAIGGWGALAALLTLILCAVAVGLAYETIYCDNRNCKPLFD